MGMHIVRAGGRMISLGMAALLTGALGAVGCEKRGHHDDGVNGAEVAREPGDPALTVLASCDPSREIGNTIVIPEGGSEPIETNGNETVLFVIETDYADDPTDIKHKALFYVLGGEQGRTGKAVVRGRYGAREDASLVHLEDGWLWVSDTAPPNYSGPRAGSATVFTLGGAPGGEGGGAAPLPRVDRNVPWVTWSIISLLQAEWTWAGSEATEFIFRVDAGADESTVFGLETDPNQEAILTFRTDENSGKESEKVLLGSHVTSSGQYSDPSPVTTAPGSDELRFRTYVMCRVNAIGCEPGDCDDAHTDCLHDTDPCTPN